MKTVYASYLHFFGGLRGLLIKGAFIVLVTSNAFSQTYQTNGSSLNSGNGLVRLTAAGVGNQTASAWSTTKIDLTQPYDMTFDMFFGCDNGANGGDGMTFTFQNDPRGLNAVGDGFGYLGVGGGAALSPAISIEFDTYDGTASGGSNELVADHIAIDINGNVNNTTNSFVGTSGTVTRQAIRSGRDLEDCAQNSSNYYTIRVVWNPTTHALQLYEEGTLTMTYTNDVVNTIFGGNSLVYWGFTGATGSASNEQWIAPTGSVIPWQCTSNSCCTTYALTKTGPNTVCTGSIAVGVTPSPLATYNWSTGATTPTTNITSPGTYTVNVQQLQGASLCPATLTFNISSTGATGLMTGGATICSDASTTTPISVALTGTPPWSITYSIDGVNQAPITGIASSPYTFPGRAAHTYALTAVTDASPCNGSESGTAVVKSYPALPNGHDNTFPPPSSTTLSVDNNGGTYQWYTAPTGGAPVFTGTVYNTPVLAGTTTYYVVNSAITSFTTKSVAYLNNTLYGTGGNNTQTALGLPKADLWMNFTPTTNFTFNSVSVDVNITASPQVGGSQVSVTIDDLTNGALSTTVNVPVSGLAVGTRSVLVAFGAGYNIIAGHNYRISYAGAGSVQGMMYWDFIGARGGWTTPAATITKDTELSITVPNQGWYPGIFNWQITVGSPAAACGRTPVTAFAALPVNLLYFKAHLKTSGIAQLQWSTAMEENNNYFTVQRSADGKNFTDVLQTPGAGNSNSIKIYNELDLHALSGVSYYRLKQTDVDGKFTYSNIVRLNDSNMDVFSVTVSPNPSATGSTLFLDVFGAEAASAVSIAVYDMLGRLLYSSLFTSDESGSVHEDLLSYISLTQGTYIVAVVPEGKQESKQKILIY